MTIDAFTAFYLWFKAAHVISMVAWLAGLFYLPRLFVYHCEVPRGSPESERFKLMEHRLLKQIVNPAMIGTFLFGILLILTPRVIDWRAGWWHVKLAAVALMVVFHIVLVRRRRDFLHDRNTRRGRYYRIINEIPAVLLVVIVVMVIVRPF